MDSLTERERLAVEFAEQFALTHTNMGPEFFERMNANFSPAEIVELSGFVGFCLGIGRIYTVLDIANECPVVH